MRVAGVLGVALLCACQLELEPELQICGDLLCPLTAVCVDNQRCVTADEAQACLGMADGTPCSTRNVTDGVCGQDTCIRAGCGNGVVETGEMCDDGNVTLDDGCSEDCKSDESCGNGVLDFHEDCDDGSFVSGDGCSSTCRNEKLVFVTVDRPGPTVSDNASMVYAAALQQVVYFSGSTTWLFDTTNGWRRGPDGPSQRYGEALAYDSGRQKVVLHGGYFNSTALSDTWELDATGWTLKSSAGGPSRLNAAMAYDPGRQRIILFGGSAGLQYFNTVHAFDGSTWTPLTITGTPPVGRQGAELVYDNSRQALVLVGGNGSGNTVYPEMWQLGSAWTQLSTSVPTSDGVLAYDVARSRLVLYDNGTVWETQSTTWTARTDTPAISGFFAMAYDTTRARIVMAGGSNEHWEVAANWTQNRYRPPTMAPVRIGFDRAARRLVVRGIIIGGATETWTRDVSGTWTLATPRTATQPPGGWPMVYDSIRGRMLVVGDNGSAIETWTFDGTAWTKLTTTGTPPRRLDHGIAFDNHKDRVVMFGGSDPVSNVNLGDTWVLSSNAWTRVASPNQPEPRYTPPLAYDASRQRVVLANGMLDGGGPIGDCWELEGDQWLAVESPPQPRGESVLVYDELRRRAVEVAGWDAHSFGGPEDVLEFDGADWTYAFPLPLPDFTNAYDATFDPFMRATVAVGLAGDEDDFALGYYTWTSGEQGETCSGTDDLDIDGLRGCEDPDCYAYCDPTCPPGTSCATSRARCGDSVCNALLETHDRCPGDCP